MSKMTDEEFAEICAAQTEVQYHEAVQRIKRARDGEYPDDWWARVVQSGTLRKITARWGGDDQIRLVNGADYFGRGAE